ncbi:MAG: ankyrin repeat domain-containing protein [bacterium]|nr:ankyrin repeat domain-containing protein [bacterium]
MNATMHVRLLWAAVAVLLALQVIGWAGRDIEVRPPPEPDPALAAMVARLERLEQRVAVPFAEGRVAGRAAADAEGPDRRAAPGSPGALPTVLAALAQRVAALEAAVDGNAPDVADSHRATAERELIGRLNAALAGGDEREIVRLLALGLDLNRRDEDGQTPLAAAAIAGRLADMDTLLTGGARLERKARRGMTPLLAAIEAGQEDAALRLLDRGASVTAVDKNGEGVLLWAAFNGLDGVAARALQLGAVVDHQAYDGTTALMDASRRGYIALVRRLLAAGADPNVRDKAGRSALAYAVEKGHDDVAALLRQHGAR